jgi:hypothetical protein
MCERTDSEVLFYFCAFSDHALDYDFVENGDLEELIRKVQDLGKKKNSFFF